MVWLAPARTSVVPSGAALATEPVPMVPPAPARFSTITLRPSAWPSSALIERAMVSCTAPAPKGTTMRMTPPCAWTPSASAQSAAARRNLLMILLACRGRRFLWPVVVRGKRVRREHVALRRHHLGRVLALRLVDLLEGRAL